MNIDPSVYPMFVFLALGLGFFIYQFTTKGAKGAFFGGKVGKKLGTISLGKSAISSQVLNLYEVDQQAKECIGFEIVSKAGSIAGGASYFCIPKENASDLASLLVDTDSDQNGGAF